MSESLNTDHHGTIPWFERSQHQFALRLNGATLSRVLMHRWADADGLDSRGEPAPWADIATFGSYNDADMVLHLLRQSASGGGSGGAP